MQNTVFSFVHGYSNPEKYWTTIEIWELFTEETHMFHIIFLGTLMNHLCPCYVGLCLEIKRDEWALNLLQYMFRRMIMIYKSWGLNSTILFMINLINLINVSAEGIGQDNNSPQCSGVVAWSQSFTWLNLVTTKIVFVIFQFSTLQLFDLNMFRPSWFGFRTKWLVDDKSRL